MSFPAALAAGATPFVLPGIIKAVASGYLGVLAGRRIPFTKEAYSITK
jgi:biotin transport system substrate-specific component